jgi:hypothetical protein
MAMNEETDKDPEAARRPQPVHEERIGRVKAAVWAHAGERGVRYSVTVCRVYKDGDKWQRSEGFSRDDLLVLAKVADLAHTWLCENAKGPEVSP